MIAVVHLKRARGMYRPNDKDIVSPYFIANLGFKDAIDVAGDNT